jgi:hypothetical protein
VQIKKLENLPPFSSDNEYCLTEMEFATKVRTRKRGLLDLCHMGLQFEDCVDCIQALFPQFDSVWIFDHSFGHD